MLNPGFYNMDCMEAISLVACYDMGFDYWGFEIDEEYYRMATERLEEEMAQIRFDL